MTHPQDSRPVVSRPSTLRRRDFLIQNAAAGLALPIGLSLTGPAMSQSPATQSTAAQPTATSLVAGKDARLLVMESDPTVLETPLALLAEHRITPAAQLFVRNNQQLEGTATLEPRPLAGWKLALAGLIQQPRILDAELLAEMPQTEHEMVLQCSGSGRSLYSRASQTKGTQWGRGAMGNVRFRGVRLGDLLKHLQIEIDDKARFLTAEGMDGPAADKEDFEHSMPLDDVLRASLLATHLNGEPLPAVHGGPLRLVTPGVYGTMHLKWLSRLRFEAEETRNYNHIPRYRMPLQPIQPGQKIDYTLDNSRFNWWMKTKSVVLTPEPEMQIPAGRLVIQGVAFNDGAAPITSVLVSLDQGRGWRRAALTVPKSPYAWYPWRLAIQARPGKLSIWTRAVDALGRTQPQDGSIFWNPSGYEWNGIEQIDVTVVG